MTDDAAPNRELEDAVARLLRAIGEDPEREGLEETPARVARMLLEMTSGQREDPTRHLEKVFSVDHSELVLVRDISFVSMCEHHLLPFRGTAHVGYTPGPGRKVVGLSKLARLVEGYSRRLQIQERLTSQIADAVYETLGASGAIVVMQAEHLCMSIRGVRSPDASTVTSAVRGVFKDDPRTRGEALSLILGGGHH